MCVCVPQSSPILCYPMDCTPPGSSVHGILQARILEWVAISFSTRSSQTRDWTSVFCIGWQILYHLSHQGSPRETFVMLWAEQEHFCRVFYVLFWKSSWQCWLKIIRKTHFPCARHLLHVYVLRMSYSVLFSSLILSKEPTAAPFTKYTFNGCWWSWIETIIKTSIYLWGFPGGTSGKEHVCQCRKGNAGSVSLGGEDLQEEMATHSSILAWRIPWTEEPDGL